VSDARLRDLERAWRESGALEDELTWLGERVRTGDLAEATLRLAASFGHPASIALVGQEERPLRGLPFPEGPGNGYRWRLDLETTQRCLASALSCAPWSEVRGQGLRAAIRAVQRYLLAPGVEVEALRSATHPLALGDPGGPQSAILLAVLSRLAQEWEPGSFSLDSQPALVEALSTLALAPEFDLGQVEAELAGWVLSPERGSEGP
tara:strand:+ start:203 stop:823 length:621 start_codon:yes stop_codon:yes gene_type:complete